MSLANHNCRPRDRANEERRCSAIDIYHKPSLTGSGFAQAGPCVHWKGGLPSMISSVELMVGRPRARCRLFVRLTTSRPVVWIVRATRSVRAV